MEASQKELVLPRACAAVPNVLFRSQMLLHQQLRPTLGTKEVGERRRAGLQNNGGGEEGETNSRGPKQPHDMAVVLTSSGAHAIC